MSVDAVAQPATSETTTARAGLVLALIVTCQLMIVLDATVVNVALPPIQQDLGFSATVLSWVVNAYTLAFGGLLLVGGRLGDVFGRRRVFGAGVTLFTLASLVGGSRSQRHRAYRRSRGAGRRRRDCRADRARDPARDLRRGRLAEAAAGRAPAVV